MTQSDQDMSKGATKVQEIYRLVKKNYPNYAEQWRKSIAEFGDEWEREFSTNISRVFGPEYSQKWEDAVDGYAEFCTEALRAQVYFEKEGHYKANDYATVVEECYHNPDYMKARYLPGQYLSHYVWPHHQKMLRHFVKEIMPKVRDSVSLFYEVGVGCGMYSQKTLECIPGARGKGVDISDYALEFTLFVAQSHGFGDRYSIINQNILETPLEEKADFIISQEVVEHLADPGTFIQGLHDAVVPGGWGYITAAINAAHTDHIYLYRSPAEFKAQIENAGWEICDEQIESNYLDKPEEIRPTIVGYLARRS